MSNYAIRAEHLSKQYRITRLEKKKGRMLRDVIGQSVSNGWNSLKNRLGVSSDGPGPSGANTTFWALRDVSFEIRPGESVGVIGSNGAGKSTLLKILSRITAPSAGRVHLKGRVGSLLEVGTGFHQDLTGRENIYLNGAILGMRQKEIERKFDEIVAFSEVEDFLDTPVKYYSSGMRMRLAFSVAAHLEPEILLIDEVLAVGDVAFQKKSLNKMGDVISEGRTVIFVSHNMPAVRALCQQGIYIQHGSIVFNGTVEEAVQRYLDASGERMEANLGGRLMTRVGAQIHAPATLTGKGDPSTYFPHDQPIQVRFDLHTGKKIENAFVSVRVFNQDLETVLVTHELEYDEKCLGARPARKQEYRVTIPGDLLPPGTYFLSIQVSQLRKRTKRNKAHVLHSLDHVAPFTVFDNGSRLLRYNLPWAGIVHTPVDWKKVR